jgi:hypothetical protein
MKNKKRYYPLDEIGFVGTQNKKDRKIFEKDIRDTVQYIKSKKTGDSIKLKRQSTTVPASTMSQ